MPERVDPKETVTYEDLLLSNTIEQETLVNLLEAKGIIKKSELIEEIRKLRNRQNTGRVRTLSCKFHYLAT